VSAKIQRGGGGKKVISKSTCIMAIEKNLLTPRERGGITQIAWEGVRVEKKKKKKKFQPEVGIHAHRE